MEPGWSATARECRTLFLECCQLGLEHPAPRRAKDRPRTTPLREARTGELCARGIELTPAWSAAGAGRGRVESDVEPNWWGRLCVGTKPHPCAEEGLEEPRPRRWLKARGSWHSNFTGDQIAHEQPGSKNGFLTHGFIVAQVRRSQRNNAQRAEPEEVSATILPAEMMGTSGATAACLNQTGSATRQFRKAPRPPRERSLGSQRPWQSPQDGVGLVREVVHWGRSHAVYNEHERNLRPLQGSRPVEEALMEALFRQSDGHLCARGED